MLPEISLNKDWYTLGVYFLIIILSLGFMELIRKFFPLPGETMRKIIHVSVGILVISCIFLFDSRFPPVVLASFFIVFNMMAIKFRFLNAIHGTTRKSYGTVFFPITFLILCYAYWNHPPVIVAALSILTFSDTLAAVVGNRSKHAGKFILWRDSKTLAGSLTMYISSFILISFITYFFSRITQDLNSMGLSSILIIAAITSAGATIGEAISSRGSDNISAPLLTALLYDLTVSLASDSLMILGVWAGASLVIFIYLLKFRFLSTSGMLIAFLMGIIIFRIGGAAWILPMIVFLISSSLLSRISPVHKTNRAKSSQRDMVQVLANGGFPLLISILFHYTESFWLYPVFLAGIAAATADTWATEIGGFSRSEPRHILTFKPVPRGTSGGVSVIGTTGSLLGAMAIGMTGMLFGLSQLSTIIILISGFLGSLIDSILGATAQSTFQCQSCDKQTENRFHCTAPTIHIAGFRWIDNDMVNFLNTVSSSAILLTIGILI